MTDLDHEPGSESPEQAVPFGVLVATVPVALGLVDLELQALTFVNARWREFTGIELPTPIPFAELSACLHPDDVDVAVSGLRRMPPIPAPLSPPRRGSSAQTAPCATFVSNAHRSPTSTGRSAP